MSEFKIYHNPRCSKSRQTLALLQENKVDIDIIEYLKTPPTAAELKQVMLLLKIEPQELMRKNEDEFKQAGLDDKSLTKDQQIALMVAYPKVIERPIVIGKGKAAIGRPPESVLEII